MKTEHDLGVTLPRSFGGHPMRVRIVQGPSFGGFGAVSVNVHNEDVMREVPIAVLRELVRIYDALPPLPENEP